jgi:hypothetical protein
MNGDERVVPRDNPHENPLNARHRANPSADGARCRCASVILSRAGAVDLFAGFMEMGETIAGCKRPEQMRKLAPGLTWGHCSVMQNVACRQVHFFSISPHCSVTVQPGARNDRGTIVHSESKSRGPSLRSTKRSALLRRPALGRDGVSHHRHLRLSADPAFNEGLRSKINGLGNIFCKASRTRKPDRAPTHHRSCR